MGELLSSVAIFVWFSPVVRTCGGKPSYNYPSPIRESGSLLAEVCSVARDKVENKEKSVYSVITKVLFNIFVLVVAKLKQGFFFLFLVGSMLIIVSEEDHHSN